MPPRDTPDEENQRLESRGRENRKHGSEGGEGNLPYPYRLGRSVPYVNRFAGW
jgi:hypothetical protein